MAEPTLLIDKAIIKIKHVYRSAGINIQIKEYSPKDRYRSLFVYIFNFIWSNSDIFGAILWFCKGVLEHRELTELTYVAPCITICCLGIYKAYCMIRNEKTTNLLIEKLRKLEIEQKERIENSETKKIIATDEEFLNKVIKVLNIFYILLLIGFALSPLMLILLNYLKTNKVELLLPFFVIYPFDPLDIRYYPWIYIKQIWSEIVVVVGLCAADFMFYIFCSYLRIQFCLLGYYLKNIIAPESKSETLDDKKEIKSKLMELVKWHQQLKSCVDLLESLYASSTLFNFVSSSTLICFTGFNVLVLDDVAFVLTFLCFLLMSLLQIFFLCFFGDLLMESSMEVGDAIYNSNWYLTDNAFGKSVLLIQTRAQTPCKLTASKFAVVNLKAFMKICSTAWSYFALLQTVYKGPDK